MKTDLETAHAPGFRVGRVLDKVGMKAQDTAEMVFDDYAGANEVMKELIARSL